MEACQKFPEDYMATVDSGDLRESDLREKIEQLKRQMSELSDINDRLQSMLFRQQQEGALDGSIASRMSGAHSLMATYGRAKQKLQEKLDKLLEFNGRSPEIFAEINGLKEFVKTGTSVASVSWNSSVGTFTMPQKADMAWVNEINMAQTKRDFAKFEGCELVYHPGTSEVGPYYLVSKVGNSAEENARLTSLYHQMVKNGNLNLGMLRGMKIGDIPAEEMLVKKTDDLNTVYQKYILCASKGIHPHTGKKLTAAEKNKFLYAGMVTPAMDALGQVFIGRMVKKMADQLESDSLKGGGLKKVSGANFGNSEKLEAHYSKHGGEFGSTFSNVDEYLAGANDVINKGTKVQYNYKGEVRTGYVKFMKNSSLTNVNGVPIKSYAKFEFVGTNNLGEITTYHVESGKTFWKMMNDGKNIPVINPIE